jgi:hypothetical protein
MITSDMVVPHSYRKFLQQSNLGTKLYPITPKGPLRPDRKPCKSSRVESISKAEFKESFHTAGCEDLKTEEQECKADLSCEWMGTSASISLT